MVNTVLPEDLGTMEVRCYIHDAKQLRWAVIGVEDARMAKYVEMSMLQCRQPSGILSEDGRWKWTAHIATGSLLPVAADGIDMGQWRPRRKAPVLRMRPINSILHGLTFFAFHPGQSNINQRCEQFLQAFACGV